MTRHAEKRRVARLDVADAIRAVAFRAKTARHLARYKRSASNTIVTQLRPVA